MPLDNTKTVFISGSAYEYGRFGEIGKPFIKHLSKALLKKDFKIVTGFGLGVGSQVVEGAIDEIHLERKELITDHLECFPFPYENKSKIAMSAYRTHMISRAGIVLFLFGNKLEDISIKEADGVLEEFEIAKSNQALLIPVGASGYASERLWERVVSDYDNYFDTREKFGLYQHLGSAYTPPETLIDLIIRIAS